ncbi:RNA polymerase sigma-70 factor [Pedobacter sp. AW31-3R]|uniref:RNA polymerase sigma-70 factor n=1 Tax=Pedobacter sp. AW31-3R TaxID=3445781 RepID=UPI003F9FA4A4
MKFNQAIDVIVSGQDLLYLIEHNNKNAFTDFYSNNFQKLILVSDKYVKDVYIAEEIVQDVFLKIWEDKDLLLNVSSIRSYLYRSVVNSSLNYVNRQRNIEKHHLKIAANLTDDDIELINDQNEMIVMLYKEIELLPEKCRNVFKLSRLEGMKYKDIAIELGISEKTVENHMGNALKILRSRIGKKNVSPHSSSKSGFLPLISIFLF